MELYQRIKKVAKSLVGSDSGLATFLGIKQNTFCGYLNPDRQNKLWPLLPRILAEFPRLSRQWLYFGEGPMLIGQDVPLDQPVPLQTIAYAVEAMAQATEGTERSLLQMLAERALAAEAEVQERNSRKNEVPTRPTFATPGAVPMVGFASCSIMGWSGRMSITVPITLPHPRPDMIAVVASGESMLPAGIGHGHVCWCDPHTQPTVGECVYVEHKDGLATLKQFCGQGNAVGGKPSIKLMGWHDKEGNAPQKHFYIEVIEEIITVLAPVVYVQRRM